MSGAATATQMKDTKSRSKLDVAKEKITAPLFPYQEDGVKWMIKREMPTDDLYRYPRGGILADEMGLGKTLQAISLICSDPHIKPTLVIAPKSLVLNWCDEFVKFAPHLKVYKYDTFVSNRGYPKPSDTGAGGIVEGRTPIPDTFKKYDVVIVPITLIVDKSDDDSTKTSLGTTKTTQKLKKTIFHKLKWGRIIIDEGHMIKSKKSKRAKSAKMLISPIKWILTGTPVHNRVEDFYSLMEFIGINVKLLGSTDVLLYKKTYLKRRTKEDVKHYNAKLDIPPPDFQIINVDFETKAEQDFYRNIFQNSRESMSKLMSGQVNMMDCFELLLRCRQACINPQLFYNGMYRKESAKYTDESSRIGEVQNATEKPVKETWDGNVTKINCLRKLLQSHPDDKTLIFCNFTEEIHIYMDTFKDEFNVVQLIGSMDANERDLAIQKFMNDPECKVFFIQLMCGGVGLNLYKARYVYFTSPYWTPSQEEQAWCRAHRIGQTERLVVRYLISCLPEDSKNPNLTTETIETRILCTQDKKRDIIAEILDDDRITERNFGGNGLGIRDYRSLFTL